MLKNKLVYILGSILFSLYLAACSTSPFQKNNKIEVCDMANRKMLVPADIKRVYVNKMGAILLYAIDPDLAVCRTLALTQTAKPYMNEKYCTLPYSNGSDEDIIRLHPDIIINYTEINNDAVDKAQKQAERLHIPVFLVDLNITKYKETFTTLGKLLNREDQTSKMTAFVHRYLDTIAARAQRIPNSKRIKVYYAEGEQGLQTDPSGSWHSQSLDFAGAINVAKGDVVDVKGMSQASIEQIMVWNPDIILCWSGYASQMSTLRFVTTTNFWQTIPAVKKKNVFQIPFTPFGWIDRPPCTNRILGTVWVAWLLYPEIFKLDIKKVTSEYFETFYHRTLSEKELQIILNPDSEELLLSRGQKSLDN